MNVVEELEELLLSKFREAKELLSAEFPEYRLEVSSLSIGSLTEYQGHSIFLECFFPDAGDHECDHVVMEVGVKYITTAPKICSADVVWGNGKAPGEGMYLVESPIDFTEHNLRGIAVQMPKLVASLRQAIVSWTMRKIEGRSGNPES